ncbi:MAG: helix-turn-helix transcriptional regulator [Ferruginibacter sp.]
MATIQLITAEGKLLKATNMMLTKGNNNKIAFNNIREAILLYRVIVGNYSNRKIIRHLVLLILALVLPRNLLRGFFIWRQLPYQFFCNRYTLKYFCAMFPNGDWKYPFSFFIFTFNISPSMKSTAKKVTPREKEVLGLLAKGMSGRSIATELGITAETVKKHLKNI